MSSTRKGQRGPSRDLYITPHWVIDILARRIEEATQPLWRDDIAYVIDIGAGDGRIGDGVIKLFPKAKLVTIEPEPIELVPSFQKRYPDEIQLRGIVQNKPFFVVSNPPFSQSFPIVPFCMKELDVLGPWYRSTAVFLLPVDWIGSKRRRAFHRAIKPEEQLVITPRPSFTEKGNDSSEYAWWWYTAPVRQYDGTRLVIGAKDE